MILNEWSPERIRYQEETLEAKKQRADLHALTELLGLNVQHDSKIGLVPTVIVRNQAGEDVHIGFPRRQPGRPAMAMTTGKINISGARLSPINDGAWLYMLEL